MGLSYVIFSPAVLLIMRKGLAWRKEEREKEEEGMEGKGEKITGENKEQRDNTRDAGEKIRGGG